MPRFTIPVNSFRRQYLEVPEELVRLFPTRLEKLPVRAVDDDGNEYVVDLYPSRRLLGGLGELYRYYEPDEDSNVVIAVDTSQPEPIRISFDSRTPVSARGLFVGKRYNMVAARKYELGRDYYFPIVDLLTHVFVCGVTGSGKTVLAKAVIEEAALHGIPSILVDLKGDLSSLAIAPFESSPQDFEEWIEGATTEERKRCAQDAAKRHRQGLEEFGLDVRAGEQFARRVVVRIYTPRSSKGLQMSFGSQFEAPEDPKRMFQQDRETFDDLVASLTNAFIDRLYPGTKRTRIENERNYLYEIVHYAWLHGIDLSGEEGLKSLLRLVQDPPFETIGGLPVDQYINAENRKARLVNKINTLLSGPERMWFLGAPLQIEKLLACEDGRVPVNVINVSHLDHFEDRSFVVADRKSVV